MQADYVHWEQHGLFEGFERYIQQTASKPVYDPEIRKAWIQEAIAAHKAKREGKKTEVRKASPPAPIVPAATCRELLKMMPLGFDPSAAKGLEAVYQFDVSGQETFKSHLKISAGACSYHEGPATVPGIVIRTPGDVWVAISKGELDGQRAFMGGQYTVEGDLSLLMKLKSLFPVAR
jgi:putative sterol carrier protein